MYYVYIIVCLHSKNMIYIYIYELKVAVTSGVIIFTYIRLLLNI